jgi:RNA polymerase sigma factor (sigma-70 family)
MSTADEWRELCGLVAESEDPLESPHLSRLFTLALDDSRRILGARFDASRRDDLAHDAIARLLAHLDAFLQATSPRRYFATTLRRLAADDHRGPRARREVLSDDIEEVPRSHREPAVGLQRDLRAAWARLDPREAKALAANADGADGQEIASLLGVSRANAYQILSRGKKHLRALLDGDDT